MKTVYFVRHGETEGNTGRIFQGPDTPLTELGLEQGRIVAGRCAKLSFDALISSPFRRAIQTAEIIAARKGIEVEVSDLFTEMRRPSRLAGRSRSDPEAVKLEEAWQKSCLGDAPKVEDGDDFDSGKARASQALSFLEDHSAENILVVTHGLFLRTFYASVVLQDTMTSSEFKRILFTLQSNNTGISVFTHNQRSAANVMDGGENIHWRMRIWNDHAHLG